MKVLFLNDHNLYAARDPSATLIEIPDHFTEKLLRTIEKAIPGVGRMESNWRFIIDSGGILPYTVISTGKKSDYKSDQFDLEYKLISGNY